MAARKSKPTARRSRTSVMTNRGQHFGNAWSVFSYKNQNHYKLTSDVELAHWLLFLEFDQIVRSFELFPPPRLIVDPRPRKIQLNAEVALLDGTLEWHKVVPLDIQESDGGLSVLAKHARESGANLRVFSVEQMVPLKYKIMPLLRVSACLAAGKGITLPYNLAQEVSEFIRKNLRGCIGEFLEEFSSYDPSIVCYVFAKMYADGVISVELNPHFFAVDTEWVLL